VEKIKRFKINWVTKRFGESLTSANSKKEARKNAEEGLDHDFEETDYLGDWHIESIEKIED